MTAAIGPDLKPDLPESEEWSPLDREPADTTHKEPAVHSFDRTQGRRIGSHRYDDLGRV